MRLVEGEAFLQILQGVPPLPVCGRSTTASYRRRKIKIIGFELNSGHKQQAGASQRTEVNTPP